MSKKSASNVAVRDALTGNSQVATIPMPFSMPAGFRVKKVVTVPSLVLKNLGDRRVLLICSAMRVSKVIDKKDTKREPATICDVGDVETGEQFIFLLPSVVRENLLRDYPNDDYVGKTFYIENLGRRVESQRYNDFRIAEVEAEVVDAQND